MKKALFIVLIVLTVVIIGFVSFVNTAWDDPQEAPIPVITASLDPDVIARGKHLAFGPAHCGTCHVPMGKIMEVEEGLVIPMSGGWEMNLPPGTFRAPNITPDLETGIGKLSDGEIARALRYSVNHKKRTMFPFMPFQELSDEDLTAIVSFLRSQEPVKNEVKPVEYAFLGKALLALGMLKPVGPKNTPPKSVPIEATAAYGSYIANSVANCVGCHTNRDLKTGEIIGEPFAGGFKFEPDVLSQGYGFISPNLTPDKKTGIMAHWDEEFFMARFRSGRVHKGSHMPWGAFSRMDDTELKALYLYLTSLKPVQNEIAQIVFAPGEKMPD
jgi:mono/diheme cytochrome c family protein